MAAAVVLGNGFLAPPPYKHKFYWLEQEEQRLVMGDS